jgi:hypothetical protein
MDDIDPQIGSEMRLDAQRDIIRQSLDAIINDIRMEMRDVGLTFPVYITVRNSGDALVTIASPLDPSDEQWQRASAIVCRTLEERIWLRTLARQRTCLRYCERGGYKCCRCDCRLGDIVRSSRVRAGARWGS